MKGTTKKRYTPVSRAGQDLLNFKFWPFLPWNLLWNRPPMHDTCSLGASCPPWAPPPPIQFLTWFFMTPWVSTSMFRWSPNFYPVTLWFSWRVSEPRQSANFAQNRQNFDHFLQITKNYNSFMPINSMEKV